VLVLPNLLEGRQSCAPASQPVAVTPNPDDCRALGWTRRQAVSGRRDTKLHPTLHVCLALGLEFLRPAGAGAYGSSPQLARWASATVHLTRRACEGKARTRSTSSRKTGHSRSLRTFSRSSDPRPARHRPQPPPRPQRRRHQQRQHRGRRHRRQPERRPQAGGPRAFHPRKRPWPQSGR
jgi:hypothetical protein